MHITILALGSRGDVQPFVPLGRALQDVGHQVRVGTFELFSGMISDAGLDFYPIHGDAQALLNAAAQGNLLTKRMNPLKMTRALKRSYATLADHIPQDLSRLSDTDLLLNQLPAHLFGEEIALHLGIPWAILSVIPLARTRFHPMIGFPDWLSFLPGYNLFTYRLAEQIGWQLFRSAINNWRKQMGMPEQKFFGNFEAIHRSHVPILCGFSEHVVPRPPDWGEHVHMTGWWYPDDSHWRPPAELLAFLDSGDPPLFIGFGSMPVPDPQRTTAQIVDAVRLCRKRAILHAGWAGLGGKLPPEILPVSYAPYGWLFPRLAGIIHHGGSGTTGFALRSGVPSLVVPFGFDQFYWGKRTAELGVGPQALPFRQLNVVRLAEAIQELTSNSMLRQKASELEEKIRAEDGLQRAVEIIGAFWPGN